MKGLSYKDARIVGRVLAALGVAAIVAVTAWAVTDRSVAPDTEHAEPQRVTVTHTNDSLRLLANAEGNAFEQHLDSMPPVATVRLKFNHIGNHGRVFNDSNYVHLDAADAVGIKPIGSLKDSWQLRRPLVKIESCREYFVDELTHSEPYLVPEAQRLLADIGRQFNDKVRSAGGGGYRIKVTSVLRTPDSIKRLRRRNGNAVEASAHQYGTTFDISYSNFICDNDATPCTIDDLKGVLAEVLNDLRNQGRCYVKHERKQACFHITVRPDKA